MNILISLLTISGVFFTLIGILTVFYWLKPSKEPADSSNRINRISSWWIGLTRPEVLATSYAYFRQDVMDNVEAVQRDNDHLIASEDCKWCKHLKHLYLSEIKEENNS